jgi:acyl transferase domain-containing protein/NAD(P)-dependent dehydrogenase (short-subunit alcohol dehydrogenase family)/acyl carrier protein
MNSVVIIGAQCRFPGGASSPDEFFNQLIDKKNFVSDVPDGRWNADKFYNDAGGAGKTYVRRGHWLDYDYKSFDASSFGMAPREVEFMDPQQRLLLETTWQAFENAGIDIAALSGRQVGVYVGGFTVDHLINEFSSQNRWSIDTHSAAGATLTMLANRISYAFNLTGPSFALDTACSSSLVAFVQAVQDLQQGRCEMAVVGGVNFMLRPEYAVAMSKGRFLARDGRSKSFDAAADGYGRGEGCGVLILRKADDALADGNEIIAYVDGAGVNQDGRTSGITVPNPKAQEALMRQVLQDSDVDAATILYVEAHGTGTPVGDPLEVAAIAAVYADGERDAPCLIGSVKSNIGHLEAAAGVAGLIKAAWILRRNVVPPLAMLETPNPALPLHHPGIALATEHRVLGPADQTRRVAVNSFGYGGTNAHVILRAPDTVFPVRQPEGGRSAEVLLAPVSARSPRVLPLAAQNLAERLAECNLYDVLHAATRKRAHFEHRAVAWGDSAAALSNGLAGLARGQPSARTLQGEALIAPEGGTVFVYTGMGPQWWGMGRGLWRDSCVYRTALREADAMFETIAGFSILAEMLKDESDSRIARTEFAQPANFMLQLGLTRVLAAEGLRPDAVLGHSVGEVSAAWAAGMLPLEQALRVSRQRSRVQSQAAGQGGMLATGLSEAEAELIAERSGGKIDVAAVNAPRAVTLAGDVPALKAVARKLEAEDVFARMLTVEVAYHSAFMEPLKDELIGVLADLKTQAPHIPLYSTVTGRRVETRRYDAEYWADNVRERVRFMAAIRRALSDGLTHFVEVGPHPVLSRSILDIIKDAAATARHVPTLNMKQDDAGSLSLTLASAYVAGAKLDWAQRHPQGRAVTLPNYPFARERLWRESTIQSHDRLSFGDRAMAQRQAPGTSLPTDLSVRSLNFLHDHQVAGVAVMPGAAYLEALLAAAEASYAKGPWVLENVTIDAPFVLDRDQPQMLEVVEVAGGSRELRSSNALLPGEVVRHASATLRRLQGAAACQYGLEALRADISQELESGALYDRFRQIGLNYQNAFRSISAVRHDATRQVALARLELSQTERGDAAMFLAHPCLVDGSFQAALSLIDPSHGAYLPVAIQEMRLLRPLPDRIWARIVLTEKSPERLVCDILYLDDQGEELASITGLSCAAMVPRRERALPEGDYIDVWEEVPPPAPSGATPLTLATGAPLVILAERGDALAAALAAGCAAAGRRHCLVHWDDPGLRETLHAETQWIEDRPCIALMFTAGLDGTDPAGETALSRLRATLSGFAIMRESMPRIVLVTRGGVAAAPSDAPVPAQAALIGFARVAYAELEDLTLDSVDVDPNAPDPAALLGALLVQGLEREIALRAGRRLAPLLRASGLFAELPLKQLCLEAGTKLLLEQDCLTERRLPPLAADMLRLEVEALCLLPQQSTTEHRIFGFVGRIAVVAEEGQERALGERVCGIAPEHLVQPATMLDLPAATAVLAGWPEPLDAAVGAGAAVTQVPAVTLMAQLDWQPGQRALLTSDALGLTLAALLRRAGGVVDLMPADPEAWRETDLGSAYNLIAAPLAEWSRRFGFGRWLAPCGILVDLSPDANSFSLPAQARMLLRPLSSSERATPDRFAEIMASAAQHELPVPATPVTLAEWNGRRDHLQIVKLERDAQMIVRADYRPALRRDGTYLVTGGFGALGKETALWLAASGAGRVVVAGRRGASTPGAEPLLAAIRAAGSEAVALALDTSDVVDVHATVAALDTATAPLRGVFHAAGTLADKPVLELTDADISSVLRPKLLGAVALDRATRGRALDHFVLFSSIAQLVGNPRQANYCAANAGLDAIAHARRAAGLPGLSINLGTIGDAGMASDPAIEAHLRQIGLAPLPVRTALAGLSLALHERVAQVAVSAAIDWGRYSVYDARGTRTTRLHHVCAPHLERLDGGQAAAVRAKLVTVAHEDRMAALTALLGEVIAAALRVDAGVLTPTRPLDEVGVDSLLAVDLQLAIEGAIGISVSTMTLIGQATLTTLSRTILAQMGLNEHDKPAVSLAAE